MTSLYLARGMTGRVKSEVVEEAKRDKEFFEACGFKVLCPVSEEGVKASNDKLIASKKDMDEFWKRDKELIRNANIIMDMTAGSYSEGVQHELAYARYHLWKPVVRVFKDRLPKESSVAYYEDDYVCGSNIEAVEFILRVHGTWFKRFVWRLSLYNRCWLKATYYRLKEWVR